MRGVWQLTDAEIWACSAPGIMHIGNVMAMIAVCAVARARVTPVLSVNGMIATGAVAAGYHGAGAVLGRLFSAIVGWYIHWRPGLVIWLRPGANRMIAGN